MTLNELLENAGTVQAPPADLIDRLNSELAEAAHRDIARRASLVRRRRIGRLATVGVGAAAAVAVGTVALQPSAKAPIHQAKPGVSVVPVSPRFTTVAEVVNAASVASSQADAAPAPYWKVVNATTCGNATGTYACDITNWTGNGRPGAIKNGVGEVMATCPGKVRINGQALSWAEANSRHRSASEVASIVADNGSDQAGRPAHSFYEFKNAIEILGGTPASPDIRKQLWRELASIPGVQLEGRQKDELGRPGWRLTLGSDVPGYGWQSVLVDTSTGNLLESRDWVDGNPPNISTIAFSGPAETAPAASSGTLKEMC